MNEIEMYGASSEIMEMAKRYRSALPGGDKLAQNEVIALAQVAKVTGLNPFVKELWYIPGKGPMIGIAGARRLWNEQSRNGGGFSHIEIIPCAPSDAGYQGDVKDVCAAFRAEAHDSLATAQYQRLFTETIRVMRESGSTDPFKDAKEICGPRPMWVGYGYSTVAETSRMNKTQLARKRAEADALKKCINVPFGVNVSAEHELAPSEDVIEAETEYAPVENINQETGEIVQPVELINPLSAEAVKYAAKEWNISEMEAAKAIASKNLGKKISKKDFEEIVSG